MTATTAQWIEGARPRTLPAAIAPVLVGTGAAAAVVKAAAFAAFGVAAVLGLVLAGSSGLDLIAVLRDTGRLQLAYAVTLTVGLALS